MTDAAQVPVQLEYPYSSWFNTSQAGFARKTIPFAAFLWLDLKL